MLLKKSASKASRAKLTFLSVVALDGFDEVLVRRKLLVHCRLAMIKLFLRIILTTEHGEPSFHEEIAGQHRIGRELVHLRRASPLV